MQPSIDAIEVAATPELLDFLDDMAHAYGCQSPEEAAIRLLDAACAFDESIRSVRLTPHPSP